MNSIFRISIVVISLITLSIALISGNVASSDSDRDRDYCYDQVGDGHFCFDTKEKCRHEQKSDEVAESPCYNKDRN
jgi:hypothetical protein